MNFSARILVLIGTVVFALSGGDCMAQAKDSPSPAPTPTKDVASPTKDAAPTKDSAPTKDGEPSKDAAPTKDGEPTKDAKASPDTKTDAPEVTDAPDAPVVTTPKVEAVPALYRVVSAPEAKESVLGSLDPATHDLEIVLRADGAAIQRVRFSKYSLEVERKNAYQITGPKAMPGSQAAVQYEPAMAAWAVVINNFNLNLFDKNWTLEKPGVFSINVVDTQGNPVIKITRTYTLSGYELTCRTSFDNLSGKPLKVVWRQNAIGDVPKESDYRGDARQVMVGYHDLDYDPKGVHIYTDEGSFTRQAMLDDYDERIQKFTQRVQQGIPPLNTTLPGEARPLLVPLDQTLIGPAELDRIKGAPPFWPHEDAPPNQIIWLASVNRYFTTIIYRPLEGLTEDTEEAAVAQPLDGVNGIFQSEIGISETGQKQGRVDGRDVTFTLTSNPFTINPGGTHAITLAVYNGPRQSELLTSLPQYRVLEFEEHLVTYELGCTVCLFQGLADFLLGFLKALHYVVSDWGIAIIILVLCVRILLHPLTKKAQISMTVMGKQMAAIQPEMKKIKEKYKDDSQKQQQEMMKLYREKGINPLGFLGCLPMFLQMPIWMALYAMLWGAIELRHEPAFFGVFQAINSDWKFLADLSTYDLFMDFGHKENGFDLPLCMMHIPGAFNILPILMAIMFYLQQKLMSPEATTDQQKQQQKMMKFMVFIFPVMLYAAPSGLTLYILASSTAGMIDSYYVRKHIKKMEEDGTLFKKKERKPGGFMDRLGTMVEQKQKQMQSRDAALQGNKGNKGGGGGRRGGGKSKKRR